MPDALTLAQKYTVVESIAPTVVGRAEHGVEVAARRRIQVKYDAPRMSEGRRRDGQFVCSNA